MGNKNNLIYNIYPASFNFELFSFFFDFFQKIHVFSVLIFKKLEKLIKAKEGEVRNMFAVITDHSELRIRRTSQTFKV